MYTVSAATVLVIYVATILENIIVVCGAVHHSVEFCVLIMSGKIEIRKLLKCSQNPKVPISCGVFLFQMKL